MVFGSGIEVTLGLIGYVAGAVLSAGAALWIARAGDRERADRNVSMVAAFSVAVWCAVSAVADSHSALVELAATLRNLALIAVIFKLLSVDGRADSLKPVRPVIIALALVQLLQPVLLFVEAQTTGIRQVEQLIFEVSAMLNMLVAIGALVLLHNLYAGADAAARPIIRWGALGLAVIFAYDLNYFTVAYLNHSYLASLIALRGFLVGAMIALLAMGTNPKGARSQFRPSRAVTFQTLSLLVIFGYLLAMVLITRSLALLGGDIARAGQVLFLAIALAAAIFWLPSRSWRGWLRVTAVKHLFQHRYDYREEWLRFTRTISVGSRGTEGFHERAIKAVADITDSPAGLLLVPNEEAQLELSARWNWATLEVPAIAAEYALSGLLEQHNHILDLGEVRSGTDRVGELGHVPGWMIEAEDAWAVVPLIHFDRLVGAIVLARPRIERRLDWEDFDLLRVVGKQLASYLAEQAGQQALMDASRFDEFNRRMAFVMHDIKNLASQISLLSQNAQKHADNPDFRADMLVTLRNSADKLNALLERLGRYGSGQSNNVREIDLTELAKTISKRLEAAHPVILTQEEPVRVMADAESLEQALIHLVQNAIDATEDGSPVFLSVSSDGLNGQIEVIDSGSGMDPKFVRNGLFKPFVSSKAGGFGIGAFESREMIKGMGGRLMVESREGVGTRFSVSLPIAEAADLIAACSQPNAERSHNG